jgi:YbgC/YbaW family acyl-CoA thioester hydrolase
MPYEFTTRRTVEFADTDTAQIVHFARFFNYMESAEHEFFRSVGLSIYTTIDGQTFTFPRVHAECEYHSPLRFEDVVEVHVFVREVRHKAIVFAFRFTRHDAAGPTHIAHGSITTVCVTKTDGKMKAAPIPQKVLDKIQAAPAEMATRFATHTQKQPR